MEKKFKALRTIATIFKVLAWIVVACTLIAFLIAVLGGSLIGSLAGENAGPFAPFAGVFGGLVILVYGFFLFIGMYAWSEIILVLIAIEENTRKPT